MRRRTAIVGLLVAVATALLVSAPSAVAGNGADGALRAHAVAPWDVLNKLMRVTKRAVARGKIVWSSDETRTARRISNQGRKAIKWYCDQWVAYFKVWPYNARDTRAAVVLWSFSRPDSPAGRAYVYCKQLLYLPVWWYGP